MHTFKIGDEVSYGLHGKCVIVGVETKSISSGEVSFYQIKVVKNPIFAKNINKISNKDPFILIPTTSAQTSGLRPLMTKQEAENCLNILSDAEYYFPLNQIWAYKQKALEDTIRKEGSVGLAKVVGHLFVVIKKDAVPPTNILRFYENVFNLFTKEWAQVMGLPIKEAEVALLKALKNKLSQDQ